VGIPYGYNSHRSRLGRDNRPKLFRKTNISNDVAGALHPIGGRSGPDTVGLFTFLTLSDSRKSIGLNRQLLTLRRPPVRTQPQRRTRWQLARMGAPEIAEVSNECPSAWLFGRRAPQSRCALLPSEPR